MQLEAINETIAAYSPEGKEQAVDIRQALNSLLAVRTWKDLIAFLQTHTCNGLFAKEEVMPLSANGLRLREWDLAELPELTGSLGSQIEKQTRIDYLDDFRKEALLEREGICEVWVSELLFVRESLRRLLLFAAIAHGSKHPLLAFERPKVRDVFLGNDEYVRDCLHGGRNLAAVSVPSRHAPIMIDGNHSRFDNYGRLPDGLNDEGYLETDYWLEDDCYLCLVYDKRRYTHEEAIRLLSGAIASERLDYGDGILDVFNITHCYENAPEYNLQTSFMLAENRFIEPEEPKIDEYPYLLEQEARNAILEGRVTLCSVCGTPIVTHSLQSKNKQCSDSHKTVASNKRREQAYQLARDGVSLKEAVETIGGEYRASIKRWYKEAKR